MIDFAAASPDDVRNVADVLLNADRVPLAGYGLCLIVTDELAKEWADWLRHLADELEAKR